MSPIVVPVDGEGLVALVCVLGAHGAFLSQTASPTFVVVLWGCFGRHLEQAFTHCTSLSPIPDSLFSAIHRLDGGAEFAL